MGLQPAMDPYFVPTISFIWGQVGVFYGFISLVVYSSAGVSPEEATVKHALDASPVYTGLYV